MTAGMMMWLRRAPDTLEEWLIFIAIVAVFALLGWYMGKRRRQGLERVAQEMGFSFDAEASSVGMEAFLALPLLKRNSGLKNALRGAVGSGEAVVLDVQIGSGKHAQTQTVACLRLAGKKFPGFEMRPEHIFHKIGSAFGYKDIDFDGNPVFSKRYLLRGQDETAVRTLFHPGILTFFEQQPGWSVEGEREWLAVYKQATLVGPGKMREFIEQAAQVATAFL